MRARGRAVYFTPDGIRRAATGQSAGDSNRTLPWRGARLLATSDVAQRALRRSVWIWDVPPRQRRRTARVLEKQLHLRASAVRDEENAARAAAHGPRRCSAVGLVPAFVVF